MCTYVHSAEETWPHYYRCVVAASKARDPFLSVRAVRDEVRTAAVPPNLFPQVRDVRMCVCMSINTISI